jgi:hypothetical protein
MPRTQTHSPTRPRRRSSLLFAIAATILLLTVGVATAAATSNIEGIWSFNGGQIAIQPEGNGKFQGIVVSPTTFASCTHPVEQKIWKEITPQPDGSYLGFHQWYKTTSSSSCVLNPVLGPTAFRVVEEATGARYLRVCLSFPGTAQPSIPPGSGGSGATYGCGSSALIAPLPVAGGGSGVAAYKETLTLPSATKCLSARLFQIHLLEPKYDPFKTVRITIKGRKIHTSHRGNYIVATVNLKGLPHGKFTVKITATTALGHHLSGSRTYHTCVKKPKKSKPKKLK